MSREQIRLALQLSIVALEMLGGHFEAMRGNVIYISVPEINDKGQYGQEIAERAKKMFNAGGGDFMIKYKVV